MRKSAHRVISLVNMAGFAAYLIWLVSADGRNIFFTQEGVLYLLPCLPFFFVFFVLLRERHGKGS